MIATTRRKKKSELNQLQSLEDSLHKAKQDRSECGTRLKQLGDQAQAILDERTKLIHRNPEQVDHRGAPVGDNDVAALDKKAEALGDLGDLRDEHEHLKKVEAAATRRINDYISENIEEIAEALRPAAEAAREKVIAKATEFDEALDQFVGVYQRSAGVTAPVQRLTAHDVPGVDQAQGLRRQLRDFDIPAPYPRVHS